MPAADADARPGLRPSAQRAADRVAVNARLRSNFGERRDLWLVCDERFDTGTFGRNRSLPRSDARTFTLKLTYTFGV